MRHHTSAARDQRTRARSRSRLQGREHRQDESKEMSSTLSKSRRRPSGMIQLRGSLHRSTSSSNADHKPGGALLRHRSTADRPGARNSLNSGRTGTRTSLNSSRAGTRTSFSSAGRTGMIEEEGESERLSSSSSGRLNKRRSLTAKDRMRRRGSGRTAGVLQTHNSGRLGKGRGGLHRAESAKRQPLVGICASSLPLFSRPLDSQLSSPSQSTGLLSTLINGADAMQTITERHQLTRLAVAGDSSSDDEQAGSSSDSSDDWGM
jgi:hypothetical protein